MRVTARPVWGLLLVLGMTAGMTAGCGGGDGGDGTDGTGVASASEGQGKAKGGGDGEEDAGGDADSQKDGLLKYAKCMRENGVPDFPDPNFSSGGGVSLDMPVGTDPKLAEAAQQKCVGLLPSSGDVEKADPEITKQLLAYSKCMRDKGITKFPDPSSNGHLEINNDELGISTTDPKYKAAEQHCSRYMPKPPGGGPADATQEAGGGA
ncbi:hypothetical protein ACFT9I_08935 [Streptomyces sp. NPDC057137]|uniref:hypothetical protein n=1 Tax=Streptomyces sp. NPDC057137 TaxID=3346030 RepID=UPI0036284795